MGRPDGAYLLNCTNEQGYQKSAIGWFPHFNLGGNTGQEPVQFSYVSDGNFITWEGQGIGKCCAAGPNFPPSSFK
jgi:hypothetical protein